MGRLAKLVRLSASDRWLLGRACVLVLLVRIGLWVLPFRRVQRLTDRLMRGACSRSLTSTERVAWAVRTTSRYIPKASCLTQAMAAQVMLARRGISNELRIGVAKTEEGKLEAHAWVESDGNVVIGGLPDLARYTPLAASQGSELVGRALDIKSSPPVQ